MLNQISVFAANTNGALSQLTRVLADANINIYTMLANDSAEFGIIRLIVDDTTKAMQELREQGYQCRNDKVLAVDMGSDEPGTLSSILDNLRRANVFVKYFYISFDRQSSMPVAVFRTDEPETETFLRGKGYHLLDSF
ncbi:MAG: amino acid-binding protein [Megasphaera sp.]|jgi:hypothetical protein|nr:amino acid-binding protein [Megasphaera sp.]